MNDFFTFMAQTLLEIEAISKRLKQNSKKDYTSPYPDAIDIEAEIVKEPKLLKEKNEN